MLLGSLGLGTMKLPMALMMSTDFLVSLAVSIFLLLGSWGLGLHVGGRFLLVAAKLPVGLDVGNCQ